VVRLRSHNVFAGRHVSARRSQTHDEVPLINSERLAASPEELMGVYWNPANVDYYRSCAKAAQNVILQTQGASGSYGRVSTPGGINYYVDASGNQTSNSGKYSKVTGAPASTPPVVAAPVATPAAPVTTPAATPVVAAPTPAAAPAPAPAQSRAPVLRAPGVYVVEV
jgi:predicted component of type VI protein secretion system